MAQVQAVAKVESPMEKLARLERENAEMRAEIAAKEAKEMAEAGELTLSVTVAREPGTRGKDAAEKAKDKGSKGGSLAIGVGKTRLFPSKAAILKILDSADEIRAYVTEHSAELTR